MNIVIQISWKKIHEKFLFSGLVGFVFKPTYLVLCPRYTTKRLNKFVKKYSHGHDTLCSMTRKIEVKLHIHN